MSRRARSVVLWVSASVAVGLLMFAHYYLDVLARGHSEPAAIKLIEELTASIGIGICFVVPVWLARRADARGWSVGRTIAALALLLPIFSVLHTTWNWASRSVIFPLAGLGAYDYGRMPFRFAMEFPTDVLFYTLVMALVLLFFRYRAARNRELRLAHVQAELTRVRLEALEGQLRPHFLFNALNTISAVMYEDVRLADSLLTGLGDLLRRTLERPAGTEVALGDELETLELYLDIMRARFPDRLSVQIDVAEELKAVRVPPLVLQPLVENALRHGDPGPGAQATIEIVARRENGRLLIEVRDNGPGLSGSHLPRVGLGATARRLAELYGDAAGVGIENRAGGGATASLWIPYR
jgi:signal transduction histidine kinase